MADPPPPVGRDISAIMRRVHGRNTAPEVAFKQALAARGFVGAETPPDLPGKPDIVFPDQQVAIFIDGDFWHGNQWRRRGLARLEDQFEHSANRVYWLRKIRRNMDRDCRATAALLAAGWTVLRLWESAMKRDLEGFVKLAIQTITHGAAPTAFARLPQRTFAEFFAGIGLMRLGLEIQGWAVAFANDIDARKYALYQGQFPDAARHFVAGDIHALTPDRVPDVTLATASFPCTDLSLAGGRQGLQGAGSGAFWGFVAMLRGMSDRRPPLVLLENVTGFLTSHRGEDFRQALLALNDLGYSVDAFVIDAARFVPQSRQRLFVVGSLLSDADQLPHDSSPAAYASDLRPRALAAYIAAHPEIRWRKRPLPALPDARPTLAAILEDLPDDAPEWWSPERVAYLLNQMSPRHRAQADALIAGDRWRYGAVFRRMRQGKSMAELRTDGLAGCLRTPRGGSGRQILLKAGFGAAKARLITPREAARLMGADEYHIAVPTNQALFGFGDAVCVPVVSWIAQYYLNPLINELIRGRALRMDTAGGEA